MYYGQINLEKSMKDFTNSTIYTDQFNQQHDILNMNMMKQKKIILSSIRNRKKLAAMI